MSLQLRHRVVLFESRTGPYRQFRIPAAVVTPRGVVLASAEGRRGQRSHAQAKTEDFWDIDVLLRRSLDGGRTWDEPRVIIRHSDFGPGPCSNFTPIAPGSSTPPADPGAGCVHALFCHDYTRLLALRSDDDGASWSSPRDLTSVLEPWRADYPFRVFAVGPGHGLWTREGRLLAPVWLSDQSWGDRGGGHRPSDLALIYSDDHGRSWHAGPFIARHQRPSADGTIMGLPNECQLAQRDDGALVACFRSESAPLRRLISVSRDSGLSWSTPRFVADLLEPQCHGSLLAVDRGRTLLFSNPRSLEKTLPGVWESAYDRKNLTLHASTDGGERWQVLGPIETGPSGYSDLAELPDGEVLCVYESGIITAMADTKMVVADILKPEPKGTPS